MKTPKEFDYDLWKDENGKYFIRVKRTGEVSEVTKDVFRILHTDAMRMYRSQQGIPIYGLKDGKKMILERAILLSLDYGHFDDLESQWISNKGKCIENLLSELMLDEFMATLTVKQANLLTCLLEGDKMSDFARENGIAAPTVFESLQAIRKKLKNF